MFGFIVGCLTTLVVAIFFPVTFQRGVEFIRRFRDKSAEIKRKEDSQYKAPASSKLITELCPENNDDCIMEVKRHCPELDEKCLETLSQMDYYLVGRENYIPPK